MQCEATTKAGERCKNPAREDGFCYISSHGGDNVSRGLTDKQQRFVEEYCVDCNGAGAARRAGYQGNNGTLASTAHELLTNPDIRVAIDERLEEMAMSAAEVTERLAKMARGTLLPFISGYTMDGEPVLDLSTEEARQHAHLLSKVKYDRNENLVIEIHDAKDALKTLARMHGLFTDRVEHTGPGGGPIMTANKDDVLEALGDMSAEEKARAWRELTGQHDDA